MSEEIQDSVVDTEQLDEGVEQEEVIETVDEVDENVQTSETVVEDEISKIEIGGEEYTLDELTEFKQGYLRQSDYTKKTQEIAKARQEHKDAVEMYEYLKANPNLVETLRQNDVAPNIRERVDGLTPEMQRINDLELSMAQKELDFEISTLKDKYKDFDEVEVLQEADKRGISDLEFVYRALREDDSVDAEKIKKEAVDQAKKEIMEEINKNKGITRTLIKNDPKDVKVDAVELTSAQKRVASSMGLSDKDYSEWLNK